MDFNTILVIAVDGGLILFFLYALYTLPSPNLTSRVIKKAPVVLIQEPVVTPVRLTKQEKIEVPKFNSQELFELEKLEQAPREYGLSEYKHKPAEPTTPEFELPVFKPESIEISPKEYEPSPTEIKRKKINHEDRKKLE